MSSGDPASPYKLLLNGWVRDRINRLQRLSVVIGLRDQLNATLQEVDSALQVHPTAWGDPLKVLHGLRMVKYRRLIHRLVVHYAVHLDHPLVWLTSVEPVRGSPLWVGEG